MPQPPNTPQTDQVRKQKEIDDILDAALDDLDFDSDDEEANHKLNHGQGQDGNNKINSNDRKGAACDSQEIENDDEKYIDSSIESMMKQLFQMGRNNGESNPETDEVLEEIMNQLQSDFSSHDMSTESTNDNTNKKVEASKMKSQKQRTDTPKTETNGADVDQTVAKLLSDMAKLGGSEEGDEAAQVEQMGEEMMESMMKEFEKMGQKGDADDVIDGMMKQLLAKELMYEPMKQVTERFPHWLAESKPHLSDEDYNRFGNQYQYFQRIVRVYETDPDNFPRLMELMQDIQEYGQPPADIIKELAPELEFDEEGMPKMDMGVPGMPFPGPGNEQCVLM